MKNERGFTLVEMLIVLLVISVLLIITIPNLSAQNKTIRTKGCEALLSTAQAQTEAYYIENDDFPESIDVLVTEGYLKQKECPNGDELSYGTTEGEVISGPPTTP